MKFFWLSRWEAFFSYKFYKDSFRASWSGSSLGLPFLDVSLSVLSLTILELVEHLESFSDIWSNLIFIFLEVYYLVEFFSFLISELVLELYWVTLCLSSSTGNWWLEGWLNSMDDLYFQSSSFDPKEALNLSAFLLSS